MTCKYFLVHSETYLQSIFIFSMSAEIYFFKFSFPVVIIILICADTVLYFSARLCFVLLICEQSSFLKSVLVQ